MNTKTVAPLAVAAVLGLVAAKFAFDVSGAGPSSAVAANAPTTPIVVLAMDVAPGTKLTAEHLKLAQVENSLAGPGTFKDMPAAVGRVTRMKLPANMPVLDGTLMPTGTPPGIAGILPMGQRALTLRIDDVSGVAGFLLPGARIDIVSTIAARDGKVSRSVIVAQNLSCLAVGGRFSPGQQREPQEPISSVTLAVTPEQAQAIDLIASTGQTRLVLRSFGDDTMLTTVAVTKEMLLGENQPDGQPSTRPTDGNDPFGAPLPENQLQPQTRTITMIRGGVETTVQIPVMPKPIAVRTPPAPAVEPTPAVTEPAPAQQADASDMSDFDFGFDTDTDSTTDQPASVANPTTRPSRGSWTLSLLGFND